MVVDVEEVGRYEEAEDVVADKETRRSLEGTYTFWTFKYAKNTTAA
jgi:hypothetical protein